VDRAGLEPNQGQVHLFTMLEAGLPVQYPNGFKSVIHGSPSKLGRALGTFLHRLRNEHARCYLGASCVEEENCRNGQKHTCFSFQTMQKCLRRGPTAKHSGIK
jgi:hypothetical protein